MTTTHRTLALDTLLVACAISAGVHGALTPGHFAESTGAGLGFLAATMLLAALVVALTLRPQRSIGILAAGAVLAALIAGYVMATTTGVPLLHPEPEQVETIAVLTKLVEGVGLVVALHVLWRPLGAVFPQVPRTKGNLT